MKLLVINQHYYRTTGTGRGIYPTTPAMLRALVSRIRDAGWLLGTQADLLAMAEGCTPTKSVCVLTFDDGLKEQMAAIADLQAQGAAAVCFVPTGPILDRYVLDVHKLHMVRAVVDDSMLAKRLHQRFGFYNCNFDEEALSVQYRYDEPLSRRVKYFLNFMLDEAQRDEWLSQTFSELIGDEREVAERLYMTRDDVRQLARAGLLGSHTDTHLPLATLEKQQLEAELAQSYERLRTLSGVAPSGISYPYGGQSAVNEQVFNAARACGYRYGLTMKRGVNGFEEAAQPMSLNRIDINDHARWLSS